MKTALILFPRTTPQGSLSAFDWWVAAAADCGIEARIAFFEDFVVTDDGAFENGAPVRMPDIVVMRGYNTPLSMYFERGGCYVVNTWQAMQQSLDKRLTHACLRSAGIPTPPTVWSPSAISYDEAASRLGVPFIVKQHDGSRGVNVFLVGTGAEYEDALLACGGNALLQKFVSSSRGRDMRVWVIGDKVAGSVLRYSDNSFLSNYSQGGKAAPCTADGNAASLAVRASRCLGLEFAGVDLLFDEDGTYTVCEVNGNPGFRTLAAVNPGADILRTLFEYIISRHA